MLKFAGKRIMQLLPTLFVVSVIIFVMVRGSGIDPAAAIIGDGQTSAEVMKNIYAKYNLDKPLPIQYLLWISGVLKGDFGVSYRFQQSVSSLILDRMAVTAGLAGFSSILAIIIAIPAGILCAVRKYGWLDRILSMLALVFFSSPVFLTCLLMILLLSKLAPGFAFTGSYDGFAEYLQRLLFPVIALAFHMIALTMRVTRTSMIEQLESDYVLTAKAKGLPNGMIIVKHAFKNALIPVITVSGIQIGALIVGAVLVEYVFSLPGLGSLLIESIKTSDYPIVQAISLLLVSIFLIINLIVDILYAIIDPRIRVD